MKDLLKKIFSLQYLVIFGGMFFSLALAFGFVHFFLIPRAMAEYGITPVESQDEAKDTEKTAAKKKEKDKKEPSGAKESKKNDKAKEKGKDKAELGPTVELNPIVVNLAGTDARRFLKTRMVLELNDEKAAEDIKARSPQIYDLLIDVLSSYKVYDLTAAGGKERIRSEVLDRLNLLLPSGTVVNVYLNELVVQ